jgi:hypothetical protein
MEGGDLQHMLRVLAGDPPREVLELHPVLEYPDVKRLVNRSAELDTLVVRLDRSTSEVR